MVAIDRGAFARVDRRLEGTNLREELVFAGRVVGKREGVAQVPRGQIIEFELVPGLEVGMTDAGIVRAAEHEHDNREHEQEGETQPPAHEPGHGESLLQRVERPDGKTSWTMVQRVAQATGLLLTGVAPPKVVARRSYCESG